jgi:hypothetical protein
MNWLQGKRTYIAAIILAALGVYLVWTGNVPMAVMAFAAGLSAFGIRSNNGKTAEMIARDGVILKKLALKQPLTPEEQAQLAADGIDAAEALAATESPEK